jgi:Fe-S-cluster containining protein
MPFPRLRGLLKKNKAEEREIKLDPHVFLYPEAETCNRSGNCCYNQSVLLTHLDVRRIVEQRPDLDVEQVIVLYTPKDGYVDAENLAEFPAPVVDGEQCYLGLRFMDEPDGKHRRCPFFDDVEKSCTIHPFKPLACKTYPFILNEGGISRLEKARCDPLYHPTEAREIIELYDTLLRAGSEFDAFRSEVDEWNAGDRDRSTEAFITAFFKVRKKY